MIGIIGDTHWGGGYNIGKIDHATQLNTKLIDCSNTFNRIVDKMRLKKVSHLVLTGDIFESRHPTAAQLNEFSKCIRRALSFGMEIIVCIGNHDQMRHISTTTLDMFDYLNIDNLSVYQDFGIHTINKDLHLILMPYKDRRMIGAKSNSEAIENISDNIKALINSIDGKKIIVGHFMMESYPDSVNPDEFSINELILPLNMFDDCDAVLMGHIHEPKVISNSKPVILYTGSMERNGFGEKGYTKSSVILDPDNLDNFEVIDNETRPLYEIEMDFAEKNESFKNALNDIIINEISNFHKKNSLKDSIVKVSIKTIPDDLSYSDEALILKYILECGAHNCSDIKIYATHSRQLRNAEINETLSTKDAFTKFISSKSEFHKDEIKELIKIANNIIDEVDGA